MRALLAGLLALSGLAYADDHALYDGGTGATCAYLNVGAKFEWVRQGGDWVDANGVQYGQVAFSSTSIRRGSVGAVVLDAGRLVGKTIMLRRIAGNGTIDLASRESSTPPRIEYFFEDGSSVSHLPTADVWMNCPYSLSTGKALTLRVSGNAAMMEFPAPPEGAIRADLIMHVVNATGDGTLGLFAVLKPSSEVAVTTGLAKRYPGDVGLGTDPAVLYFEDWESPDDWWRRTGKVTEQEYEAQKHTWTQDGRFPRTWRDSRIGEGFLGSGLELHFRPEALGGTGTPDVDVTKLRGKEADELYVRYYIRMHRFVDPPVCDGGKLPGFSSPQSVCGHAGMAPDGYCGWSARGHFSLLCDRANPIYPKIKHGVYLYHPEQAGSYGDALVSSARGAHGLIIPDQWHCVETRVKVNTPGQRDGAVQTWIDGKLGVDKASVVLRYALDAEHPTYAVPGELGISQLWGTVFFGGKHPMGQDGWIWYDQIVVATERIGCVEPVPVPVLEICGDGIDNNGDGAIDEGCAPPPAEICGNGLDDDDDGQVDEGCTPPKTDLEIAQEALAKALEDLEAANLQIATLQGALTDKSTETASALAALAQAIQDRDSAAQAQVEAEAALATAQETIDKVREIVR